MAEKQTKSVFSTLNAVNLSDKTAKKNGMTYLSWPYAWGEVKKAYPEATYTVYENVDGWNYHTDGRTCWVKTGVTINGIEHIEYLPVMDYRNNSIPADKVTSTDVNKAIQRSLTKACARHGLGLYIYAGEDIPEDSKQPMAQPSDVTTIREKLAKVTTESEMNALYRSLPKDQQTNEVIELFKARKAEMAKGGAA